MPEEQKPETGNVPAESGYYKDTWSKVTDFLVGFLGYPIIGLLAQFALTSRLPREYAGVIAGVMGVVMTVLTIFIVVFAYKRGRKFIAVGILSLLIVPLIAAGSCLLIVMAVSH